MNKVKFYIPLVILITLVIVRPFTVFGNEPSGFKADSAAENQSANNIYYAAPFEDAISDLYSNRAIAAEEKKDSTEVEPKLEQLVLGGSGAVLIGVGVAVAAPFVAPILFLGAALMFALGAFLTAKGWKKIKAEPKKFKGEKIAITNYLVIGLIGVAASFYLLYLLFSV